MSKIQPRNNKDLAPPKCLTGNIVKLNKVVLCSRCNGFGFIEREELYDYHKNDYRTTRENCATCEGDGRMIETTTNLMINSAGDDKNLMPYISFKDIVDPHGYENKWIRYRLDQTDQSLESKYPDLAAVSYDKYDELVEKYRLIELLKKEAS